MDEGGREREGGSARERENAGPRPGPRLWTFFPNNKVPLVENLHIRVTIQVIEPRRKAIEPAATTSSSCSVRSTLWLCAAPNPNLQKRTKGGGLGLARVWSIVKMAHRGLTQYRMSERAVNHKLRRVAMSKEHDAKSLSEL